MSALTGKGLVTAGGFNPGTVGASAIFDGSADYLTLSTGSVNGALSEFWAGGWALRTETGEGYLWYSTEGGSSALLFTSSSQLQITANGYGGRTSALFRDIGWYHVVFHFNGTSSELYVNGESVPFGALDETASFPSTIDNDAETFYIGRNAGAQRFDGYIAQSFYIEGSLSGGINDLAQTFTAGTNGTIWAPKPDASIAALAAAAGGNSYCLTDGIAAGTDASGNGNNFTPSGSPTASDNTPSKVYAVINPLQNSAATVSAGSLSWSIGAADGFNTSTLGMTSGKWVCEYTETGSNSVQFGVVSSVAAKRVDLSPTTVTGGAYFYADDGNKYVNGSSSAYGVTYTASDVIRIELDLDTPQVEFFKNGSSQGTISITETDETWFFAGGSNSGSASYSSVFIEGDFAGTPTAGFKALNSANLTSPDYQGADWFNALLYVGNQTARSITGVGFGPDLVWAKNRSFAESNIVHDKVRGATNVLKANTSGAEAVNATGLTSFDSDGFSLGTSLEPNKSGDNYVAWNWRGDGTSGSSNTDGSITSTVNVAAPGHFSFGTYTGTGSAATVGHGLSAAPEMIIVKNRIDASTNWPVYHYKVAADAETDYLYLSTTAAAADFPMWNDTAPTSTVFSVGTSNEANGSTDSMVFYAFRSVPGVCKVGSYTGNGSTDGPYVHLGFNPRWILFKVSSSINDWVIYDTARDTYNVSGRVLRADDAAAEFDGRTGNSRELDILADGFKPRTSNAVINANAANYIYLAMADVAGNGILPPIPGR